MSGDGNSAAHTMQRIKVGMTGLACVLLLIALAGAVLTWTTKEPPVAVIGAPNAAVVANLSHADTADAAADIQTAREPLAELGVAPSIAPETANTAAPANATPNAPAAGR